VNARGVAIAFVLLALASGRASAQEVNLTNAGTDRPNLVEAHAGLDHGFVGELGYLRVFHLFGRRAFAGGDLELPWAHPDLGDHRVRATVGMVVLGDRGDHWQLSAQLSPTLRGADTTLARMEALGLDLRVTGGWYARRGFVAGELGLDGSGLTHITQSDAYKMIYPGARDGWYHDTGGTLYAAAVGGASLGRYDLILRAGLQREQDLDPQTLPFFAVVGVSVALPR